ncbi:MAG: protein O-mannosyl-transferase family, partial [Polyangiales bacterium]
MTIERTAPERSPAPAVFVAASAVLVWLAAAGPGFRDSGEIGAAAHRLGVPHPTGFPWDVLLLRAGGSLPLGSIALRQNATVAVLSAAALALLAHLVFRLSRRVGVDPTSAAAGGVVAAVGLGAWETFLRSATAVEVYPGALVLLAAGAVMALERRAAVVAVALCFGLSFGAHVSARIGLGLVLVASWLAADRDRRVRSLAPALGAAIAGAAIVAYLPLASMHDPPVDWGDPQTLGRLWEHLTAERIRQAFAADMMSPGLEARAAFGAQLGELWPLGLCAAVGAFVLGRRVRGSALVVVLLLGLDVAYALLINPMGVADRQVGHVAAAALCVLAGAGTAWLVGAAGATPGRRGGCGAPSAPLCLSAVLAVACFLRAPRTMLADGHAASELLGSGGSLSMLPPRTVLVCSEDDVCAQALFALHAERVRPDMDVVPAQHLWEPTIRAPLASELPSVAALGGARPAQGD